MSSEFRVSGSRFRVQGSGSRVSGGSPASHCHLTL